MSLTDRDEVQARREARRAEAERLEELAFETEVQASLTRPEHPAVLPSVEARLRSLLGPWSSPSGPATRAAGAVR
jgi:hypothetical protein